MAAAKIKRIEQPSNVVAKTKDVNDMKNNQEKFIAKSIPLSIPQDQMKCNIFKARLEEQNHTGICSLILIYCFIVLLWKVTNIYVFKW